MGTDQKQQVAKGLWLSPASSWGKKADLQKLSEEFSNSSGGEFHLQVRDGLSSKVLGQVREVLNSNIKIFLNFLKPNEIPDLKVLGRLGFLHDLRLSGPRPLVHDGVRGEKGAYARSLRQALSHQQAGLGLRILVHPTKGSFRNLPEFSVLAKQLRASEVMVEFGTLELGSQNPSRDFIRFPLLDLPLGRLLQSGQRMGQTIGFRGVPPCSLGESFPFVLNHWSPPLVVDTEIAPGFSKTDFCSACALHGVCSGVPTTYLEQFGPAEFESPALMERPLAS